jgi:hypothetical protein
MSFSPLERVVAAGFAGCGIRCARQSNLSPLRILPRSHFGTNVEDNFTIFLLLFPNILRQYRFSIDSQLYVVQVSRCVEGRTASLRNRFSR